MIKIILFSGKQGAGKTTAVKTLREWAVDNGWLFHSIKFADPLYKMHDEVLGILKDYGVSPVPVKDGPLLQLLGTDWGRNNYGPDIWAKLGRNAVDKQIKFWGDTKTPGMIVIDDCRFINEVEIFPDAYKVRLDCDRDVRKFRADSWRENENHPSETQFDIPNWRNYFDECFDTNHCSPEYIVKQLAKNYLEKDNETSQFSRKKSEKAVESETV